MHAFAVFCIMLSTVTFKSDCIKYKKKIVNYFCLSAMNYRTTFIFTDW